MSVALLLPVLNNTNLVHSHILHGNLIVHGRNDQVRTVVVPPNDVLHTIHTIEIREPHCWSRRPKSPRRRAQIEQVDLSGSRIRGGVSNQIGVDRVDARREHVTHSGGQLDRW